MHVAPSPSPSLRLCKVTFVSNHTTFDEFYLWNRSIYSITCTRHRACVFVLVFTSTFAHAHELSVIEGKTHCHWITTEYDNIIIIIDVDIIPALNSHYAFAMKWMWSAECVCM